LWRRPGRCTMVTLSFRGFSARVHLNSRDFTVLFMFQIYFRAAWSVTSVLNGLSHCHRLGVCHRHLKLSNSRLTKYSASQAFTSVAFSLAYSPKASQTVIIALSGIFHLGCLSPRADQWRPLERTSHWSYPRVDFLGEFRNRTHLRGNLGGIYSIYCI